MSNKKKHIVTGIRYIHIYIYHINKQIWVLEIYHSNTITWNRAVKSLTIRRAQVKVGLINLCKGLFSLNALIYYNLKSGA
jgi:hypothetical protein